jgi:hypothetical protein
MGGRLVDFKEAHAAYISYRMHAQIISLVLTSASSSVAAGGEKTVSQGLIFHAHRRDELQVVTWSVHNLTYALVSAVNLPISQSCAVCHANAKDKNLIQNLLSGGIPIMFDIRNAPREHETVTPCNPCQTHLPIRT